MRKQKGFTLIEIAIVLVVVGLLIGGVLKGQELITAARVRNIAAQLDGIKIAYLGFQDRYRQLPGDFTDALAASGIPMAGNTPTRGCNASNITCQNGRIDDVNENESILAWHQLTRAGFITGNYDGIGNIPTATNTPTNAFSGYLQIIYDPVYLDANPNPPAIFQVKTGSNIPSSVLSELDRKMDDGFPQTGALRFSASGGSTPTCISSGPPVTYNGAADIKTCGAAVLQ
jgi:prepilin-type N-terminal cleavage/methylation domain-containing protein